MIINGGSHKFNRLLKYLRIFGDGRFIYAVGQKLPASVNGFTEAVKQCSPPKIDLRRWPS